MKKIVITCFALLILASCNKEKDILNSLNDHNIALQNKGYHFGDKLNLPQDVLDYAEAITVSYGDKETSNLTIDPKFFSLGKNDVTFNIKTKGGEVLQQDATINVFAKAKAREIRYEVVNQYPHDADNFTEGFENHGDVIYESVGLEGKSKLMKYTLGSRTPLLQITQPSNIFSEGITVFGDKIYQLTYRSKIGFVYDMNMKLIKQFDPENPSKVLRTIAIASDKEGYDQINELEYHDGSLYANVWQKPIILQINPANGEVTGIIDLTNITKQNTTGNDDVLNGIAFKGENMLITGKNWSKIYEIIIK